MATHYSAVPPSVLALPFLLARSRADDLSWTLPSALSAAIAAERAIDGSRNTRARLAWLLCELGFQLSRRGVDKDQSLPIPRFELADALGTNLSRIKRTLALLSLSGVVETDGRNLRVTDWHRLCSAGGYDQGRLELEPIEFELIRKPAWEEEERLNLITIGGDQACFV
jgi:hypothetical protein